MKKYREERFTGERALFQSSNLDIDACTFLDGESPLKECTDLVVRNSTFQWKYPLWYCNNIQISNSMLFEMARAGVWYSDNIRISHTIIEAPKTFRRCKGLELENVEITQASEALWNCQDVKLKNVTANGEYFAMGSSDMEIDGLSLVGNYSFDGVRNLTIRNARMRTRDAFWNSENVTVYDSFISGAYLGWNAKNVTLINCTIESLQGMCYMENVVLQDCKLINTNLAFEYSTVDATVIGGIDSVKNPYAGTIRAEKIGEVVFDNPEMKAEDTEILLINESSSVVSQAG